MNLIINPIGMPRHFARSKNGNWLIKRSPLTPDGFRYYSCEHWVNACTRGEVLVFKAKFLLDFVKALMDKRKIEVLVLSHEEGDSLVHDMTIRKQHKKYPRKKKAA